VILFCRGTDRRSEDQLRLLLTHLPTLAEALDRGSIVVFGDERIAYAPSRSSPCSVFRGLARARMLVSALKTAPQGHGARRTT
jgi:hypothetical protein